MARKTSTELFELVKTMTPSEKRYFRLFTSLHTVGNENKYMKLFDLMEQMEEYDEDALVVGVNDAGGPTFSKLKKYLYDLILKAMRNFNFDKNGTHQLTSAIDDVSILFNKGLYLQAQKAIINAQKVIKEFDLISYNFLIENWHQRINLHLGEQNHKGGLVTTASVEEYQVLNEQMQAFGAIQEFTHTCSAITSMGQLPNLVVEALKFRIAKSTSAKVRFFNLRIQSIYYRLNREYSAYLVVAKEAYNLANVHAAFQNEDVLIYTLEPLLEYCNALLNNRKYHDYKQFIKKATPYIVMSKMTINSERRANIDAFVNLMNSEYDRLNGKTSSYEEHMAIIKTIRADESLHPSPALKNLYYWELINWHFKMGDFEKAIGTIDKMKRDIPSFQTIQAAKAVKWLCLYELKLGGILRMELEENMAKSELEKVLSQSLFLQLGNETIGKWMTLKNELMALKQNLEEKLHFKFFDFIEWVNNRLLSDNMLSPVKRQLYYYHH